MKNDTFTLGGKEFSSRFILGSGKYSMELIKAAVENAGAQIITLAVRRTNTKKKENILDFIRDGIRSYEDFMEWRSLHPVTGIMDWMP